MAKNPRNYPDTMASAESGRSHDARRKTGHAFAYKQPGWWCSLTYSTDMEGQLVDYDNKAAEMARQTANEPR